MIEMEMNENRKSKEKCGHAIWLPRNMEDLKHKPYEIYSDAPVGAEWGICTNCGEAIA
jgi:hypothetical protein